MDKRKKYQVKGGTINDGLFYELNWILYLSCASVFDEEVENFEILRNVDEVRSWDDIVFNVKYKDEDWQTDFIQVKWKNKPDELALDVLKKSRTCRWYKPDLESVSRYCKENKDVILGKYENTRLVYLTNRKLADDVLEQSPRTPVVKYDTSGEAGVCTFNVDQVYDRPEDLDSIEAQDFCSKLILCSNQKDRKNLFEDCQNIIKGKYRTLDRGISIVRSFIHDSLNGGFVLTMDMFKQTLYYVVLRRESSNCLLTIPSLSDEYEVEFDYDCDKLLDVITKLTQVSSATPKHFSSQHNYVVLLNKIKAVIEKLEDGVKEDKNQIFFFNEHTFKQFRAEIVYYLQSKTKQILVLDNFALPGDLSELGENTIIRLSNTTEGEQVLTE